MYCAARVDLAPGDRTYHHHSVNGESITLTSSVPLVSLSKHINLDANLMAAVSEIREPSSTVRMQHISVREHIARSSLLSTHSEVASVAEFRNPRLQSSFRDSSNR